MTYEGTVHNLPTIDYCASRRAAIQRAEQRRKRKRRDNIEDAVTVLVLVLVSLLIGWRAHNVYGSSFDAIECSTGMVSVRVTDDAKHLIAGTDACVPIEEVQQP